MSFLDTLSKIMFKQYDEQKDASPVFNRASRARYLDASASGGNRDPEKVAAQKVGLVLSGDGRTFLEPETDLSVIEKAYNTEAYVRQGIDKYIDKMFKAGWKFVGKNSATVEYIKTRFAYMAEATGIPTDTLFMEYCEDVVKFSNAIIAKARMTDQAQLPPNVTVTEYAGRKPVVGYFPLNVTTMSVNRDKLGIVIEWQQEVEGGDGAVKYAKEDIIHTYYKRTKGNAFGTPFVTPVLDDIRALREAEDNVLKMLYRNINPFYHVAIGSEEYPADDTEITAAKNEIEGMSVDGGLVTSERWNIKAIAADKVIDADPYLKYFEERVFSGMGVSATMYGRGDSANKSTSDNQSAEFIDRVKAFQKIVGADVDQHMIMELLYEGGFDPILNPDDMVHFVFNEIDIDMQVKLENHAMYKYEHNCITEDEMRQLLGLDAITDRSKMFNELVTLNTVRETAKVTQQQSATGSSNGNSSTNKGNGENSENGNKATNNKIKPKNQHNPQGKETKTNNEILPLGMEHLDELGEQIAHHIDKYYDGDKVALSQILVLISFKEEVLIDINATSVNNDNSDIKIKRMFGYIRSGVADAIRSQEYNGTIAKEATIEIVNSVIHVAQGQLAQIWEV